MVDLPTGELLGVAGMLVLSAYFSSAETALTSLGVVKLEKLIEQRRSHEAVLRRWIDHPREILTTILIGNNLVNITASALATQAAQKTLALFPNVSQTRAVPIAVGVMTLLLLTFGEITPKVLARAHRERLAVFFLASLRPFYLLFYPATRVFVGLTNVVARVTGAPAVQSGPHVSEEDIELLVQLGRREGSISKDREDLLNSVFEFTDTTAREIMVPRTDIVAVEANTGLEELIDLVLSAGHSRMPVYEGKVDDIIGVVHIKDLLGLTRLGARGDGERSGFDLRRIVRDVQFVPETKPINQLMQEMQELRNHMSIVVDEFGGVAGLVTLEDIVEEFFGEIWDEHDREIEAYAQKVADGIYRIDARLNLYDLGELFDIEIPEDADYDTVGGLIAKETGTVAGVGAIVQRWGIRLTVVEADRRRLRKIRAEWVGDANGAGDEGSVEAAGAGG